MKTLTLLIVFVLLLVFTVSTVQPVFAQGVFDGPLVPCGREVTPECTTCHFIELIHNVVQYIFFVLVPAAALILFTIAGFLILLGGDNPVTAATGGGGNSGSVSKGKAIFRTTIIGIVIMFGASMFTNFLLRTLVGDNNQATRWYDLECGESTSKLIIESSSAFSNKLSSEMNDLWLCMQSKLPPGVGRITSTTDNNIDSGLCNPLDPNERFSSANNCQHAQYSCHYGGSNTLCQNKGSFAMDFGDEKNYTALREAARECNSRSFVIHEVDHVHISIGGFYGCGCN